MGEELFSQIVDATGLPNEPIARELQKILDTGGVSREDLNLDDLRRLLAEYVQDVLLAAKEAQEPALLASGDAP